MLRRIPTLLGVAALLVAAQAVALDIAIDVGHSVAKPGATSASGYSEFQFNQRFAKGLAQDLSSAGLGVRLINENGQVDTLLARTQIAPEARLFVSIHHDSVQQQFLPVKDQRFSGFSIWLSRKNTNYSESARCAAAISDSLMSAGLRPSSFHADDVPGERRVPVDLQRGIFLNDDLIVLKTSRPPALLIEVGVIVNPVEEAVLLNGAEAQRRVSLISAGLRRCLSVGVK